MVVRKMREIIRIFDGSSSLGMSFAAFDAKTKLKKWQEKNKRVKVKLLTTEAKDCKDVHDEQEYLFAVTAVFIIRRFRKIKD